jgi:hypothetical protein
MMVRQLLILGLFTALPVVSAATPFSATSQAGVKGVLAEDEGGDLLMRPSREMQGAQRLGSTEIVNPPHESFGMTQMPDSPDANNLRKARTGAPTVSGAQAKANAAEVREERRAAAAEAAGLEALTPQQIAAQAAAAQAAGIQAAVASAKTSGAAAGNPAPAEQSPPESNPPPSNQPAAPGEQ